MPSRRVVDDVLTNAIECCVIPYDVFFVGAGFKPAPTGGVGMRGRQGQDRLSVALNDFSASFVIL